MSTAVGQRVGRLVHSDACAQAVGLRIVARREQRLRIDVEAMSFACAPSFAAATASTPEPQP